MPDQEPTYLLLLDATAKGLEAWSTKTFSVLNGINNANSLITTAQKTAQYIYFIGPPVAGVLDILSNTLQPILSYTPLLTVATTVLPVASQVKTVAMAARTVLFTAKLADYLIKNATSETTLRTTKHDSIPSNTEIIMLELANLAYLSGYGVLCTKAIEPLIESNKFNIPISSSTLSFMSDVLKQTAMVGIIPTIFSSFKTTKELFQAGFKYGPMFVTLILRDTSVLSDISTKFEEIIEIPKDKKEVKVKTLYSRGGYKTTTRELHNVITGKQGTGKQGKKQ